MAKKNKEKKDVKTYHLSEQESKLLDVQSDLISQHTYMAELVKRDQILHLRAIAKIRLGVDGDQNDAHYDPETKTLQVLRREEDIPETTKAPIEA